jgi:hypothetical protein
MILLCSIAHKQLAARTAHAELALHLALPSVQARKRGSNEVRRSLLQEEKAVACLPSYHNIGPSHLPSHLYPVSSHIFRTKFAAHVQRGKQFLVSTHIRVDNEYCN